MARHYDPAADCGVGNPWRSARHQVRSKTTTRQGTVRQMPTVKPAGTAERAYGWRVRPPVVLTMETL